MSPFFYTIALNTESDMTSKIVAHGTSLSQWNNGSRTRPSILRSIASEAGYKNVSRSPLPRRSPLLTSIQEWLCECFVNHDTWCGDKATTFEVVYFNSMKWKVPCSSHNKTSGIPGVRRVSIRVKIHLGRSFFAWFRNSLHKALSRFFAVAGIIRGSNVDGDMVIYSF